MKKIFLIIYLITNLLKLTAETNPQDFRLTFGSSLGMGSFSVDNYIFDFGLNAGMSAGFKYKHIETFLSYDYTDFNRGIDGKSKYMQNINLNFTYKPFRLNKFNLFAGCYTGFSLQNFSKVWDRIPIPDSFELPTSKSLFMFGALAGFDIELPGNKGDWYNLAKFPLNNFLVWVVQSGFRFYF